MEMTELGGERTKADPENLNRIDLVETVTCRAAEGEEEVGRSQSRDWLC